MESVLAVLGPATALGWAAYFKTKSLLLGFGLFLLTAVFVRKRQKGCGDEFDKLDEKRDGIGKKLRNAYRRAHLYFLLDESGSMDSLRKGTIDGFNKLVEDFVKQKAGVKFKITLVTFDSGKYVTKDSKKVFEKGPLNYKIKAAGVAVEDIKLLGLEDFEPMGQTPLYDAIGHCVSRAKEQQEPKEAIRIVVFSDGQDNTSSQWTKASIKGLIEERSKDPGWNFAFMGAKLGNAKKLAEELGISPDNAQNWTFDEQGLSLGWLSVGESLREILKDDESLSGTGGSSMFMSSEKAQADFMKRGTGSKSSRSDSPVQLDASESK